MKEENETMFSRGQSCPLGKCDAEIKVLVPEELRDAMAGLAALEGKPLSEYARDVFIRHVYGEFHAVRLAHHGKRAHARLVD